MTLRKWLMLAAELILRVAVFSQWFDVDYRCRPPLGAYWRSAASGRLCCAVLLTPSWWVCLLVICSLLTAGARSCPAGGTSGTRKGGEFY